MVSKALIEINGLSFSYDTRPILNGIDMSMRRGQVVAIMGGSGSGKTTLLRLSNQCFSHTNQVKIGSNT